MLEQLEARLAELDGIRDQLLANLNATAGARAEVVKVISVLRAEPATITVLTETPRTKRGPKPGSKRKVTAEYANDIPQGEVGGS